MGRAKITMKYIQKEKPRKLAFNQRTTGLRSKISEYCKSGPKACLIMYNDDDNNVGPMTWAEDPTTVNSMLQEYEHQKTETPPKTFDVKDYFENKKNIVEAAIIKVRKAILKKKYPTWHPNFNKMEEGNLISFITAIQEKIEACNKKTSMLKHMQQSDTSFLQNTPRMQIMVQENVTVPQMQQKIHSPMKLVDDINELMVQKNVTIPQMQQQIHAPLKSIDDISEKIIQENIIIPQMQQRVYARMNSIDDISEVTVQENVFIHQMQQQNHAPMKSIDDISEIMVQEKVTIHQMQEQIHVPMMSIDDEMMLQENVIIPQMQQQIHAPLKLIDDINKITVQDNIFIPQMQQQIHPYVKSNDYFNETMDFADLVELPHSSSTKQLVECDNLVFNHDTQLDNPIDWTSYLEPDIFNWANNSDEFSWKHNST